MTCWVTEEDDYVCTLSEDTQRIARDELRETETTRKQAITQLREWIKTNPKILNCRLDSIFLLRFLRAKKFSVLQAAEAIEHYVLLRHAMLFANLDYTINAMEELLTAGYLFAVPGRDSLGRRVLIARPGVFDPHKYTKVDMCRIHGIAFETLVEDEESQVRGYVYFADGAGVSFPHLTLFTPREAVRIVKNGERTIPMRHKAGHVINVNPSLKFAMDFGLSLISEKIKKRVKIYSSVAELHKNIDINLLPKEYGGVMPMAEMIHLWKQELEAGRSTVLSNDGMQVRLDMYSEEARLGSVSALRNGIRCGSIDNGVMGVSGTFRKLELD